MTSARPRRMPSRTLYAAGLLTAALAVLLGAWFLSGWADVRAQQRELSAAPTRDATTKSTALAAELRSELSRLMSRELERPYFHYQNLMHDPRTSGVWGVAPSPLAAGPEDPLVLGYFQLDPKGGVTIPTINDAFPELSESRRLAEHRRFRDEVTRDLAAILTPKSEPPGVLVAEAAPVKKPRPQQQKKVPAQVIEIDPNSYVQNYSGNANEVYQQQRVNVPDNIEIKNESNVPVTIPRSNPRNVQQQSPTRNAPQQSQNPSTRNAPQSQAPSPTTQNAPPSQAPTPNPSTRNAPSTNAPPTQAPSTTRNAPATTNPSTRNAPANPSPSNQTPANPSTRNAPTTTNPSTRNAPPTSSNQLPPTNPSTRNAPPSQAAGPTPAPATPSTDQTGPSQAQSPTQVQSPTRQSPTSQQPTSSPKSSPTPPTTTSPSTTSPSTTSPSTTTPTTTPTTTTAAPAAKPKPKPRRPRPAPAEPEPVEEPKPITITISPLEWRTYMFAGAPTLVAVREVDTPDGMLAQGFVVDRSVVTSWLATRAGESVAELKTDEQAPTAAEVAPGWRLAVSANPRALVEAAADAAGVANGFLVRFVLVGVIAALALAFVVSLVARAERLARERSQFAAAAAHELRTPLAGLQLYGDMLADGLGDPGKMRDYARRMSEEASRLGRVVSNVLGFSQLERGNLSVEPQSANLGHELCELAERAQPALDRAGAALELDVPPDLTAKFDRDAVARIVGNLLDNAEKYSREADDRTIALSAREVGDDKVEVIVSDHGPGVAQDARTRLFRPFSRGVSADGPAGLGLGLALSQSLARAMGGELEYRPATGGASFVLRLPR